MKKLIFTDLDGTLLDLNTYAADQAKQSVTLLKNAGISIIFCSSKTWAEQKQYLDELALDEPVIVENGSAIILPSNHQLDFEQPVVPMHGHPAIVLGKTYDEVAAAIDQAMKELEVHFESYRHRSIERIAEITGLSKNSAAKAKTRDFSETIFDADSDINGFKMLREQLQSTGFQTIPGSKYVTISGIGSNKGTAVNMLIEAYKRQFSTVISYGIGDSQNDLDMLLEVDQPYLVQRPDRSWVRADISHLSKISAVGPAGWNVMASEILSD